MSKATQTQNPRWILMALLVGFSILNVSSFMAQTLSERALASEGSSLSRCLSDGGLNQQKTGAKTGDVSEVVCGKDVTVGDRTVVQTIKVRKVQKSDKAEDYEFEVSLDMETDCDTCDEGKNTDSTSFHPATKDIDDLARYINDHAKDATKDLVDEVEKDEQLAKEIRFCVKNPRGRKWSGEERRDCLIEKMDEGEFDDEEVAKIYDKHFKTDLTNWMQSGDQAQMQKAMNILGKLRGIDNGYMASSVQDMMQFGNMKMRAERLRLQMGLFDPSDIRYQRLEQQAAMLSRQADGYFNGRLNQVQTQSMFMEDGIGYAYSLMSDLQNWQNELDMSLSQIVSNVSYGPNGQATNPNGAPVNIEGRGNRGTVGQAPNSGSVNNNNNNGAIPPALASPVGGYSAGTGGGPYQQPMQPYIGGPMNGPGPVPNGQGMPPRPPQNIGNPGMGQPPPPPTTTPVWAQNMPVGGAPGSAAYGPGAPMPQMAQPQQPYYSAMPRPGGIGPGGTPYFNPNYPRYY